MGRATVAALTDIFRVVRVVGLFALDARKGGENFRSRENTRGDACKTRVNMDPAAFRSQKIKAGAHVRAQGHVMVGNLRQSSLQ